MGFIISRVDDMRKIAINVMIISRIRAIILGSIILKIGFVPK